MVTNGSAGRRRVRCLLALAVAAGTLAAAPVTAASAMSSASSASAGNTTQSAKASYEDMTPREYQQRLLYWLNKVRDNHSKRAVDKGDCVDSYANKWARRLANKAEFYHQDLGPVMHTCKLTAAGEILAMGGVTPRQMIGMWLDSPDHRAILLDRKYRVAGVGAWFGDNGAWYGCIDFGKH